MRSEPLGQEELAAGRCSSLEVEGPQRVPPTPQTTGSSSAARLPAAMSTRPLLAPASCGRDRLASPGLKKSYSSACTAALAQQWGKRAAVTFFWVSAAGGLSRNAGSPTSVCAVAWA